MLSNFKRRHIREFLGDYKTATEQRTEQSEKLCVSKGKSREFLSIYRFRLRVESEIFPRGDDIESIHRKECRLEEHQVYCTQGNFIFTYDFIFYELLSRFLSVSNKLSAFLSLSRKGFKRFTANFVCILKIILIRKIITERKIVAVRVLVDLLVQLTGQYNFKRITKIRTTIKSENDKYKLSINPKIIMVLAEFSQRSFFSFNLNMRFNGDDSASYLAGRLVDRGLKKEDSQNNDDGDDTIESPQNIYSKKIIFLLSNNNNNNNSSSSSSGGSSSNTRYNEAEIISTLGNGSNFLVDNQLADYSDYLDGTGYTPSMSQVLLSPITSSLEISGTKSTNTTIRTTGTMMTGTDAITTTPATLLTAAGTASTLNSATLFLSDLSVNDSQPMNPFAINGTADDGINSFYFYETEQFAVLWVLFTVIVLGNSAVLVALLMNKGRKSRMNFFIKQLALADLLVGLLHVLTDIIWRITVSWRAGNLACKVIRFAQASVTYASTYVLVALSIDRYDAITHPMNFSGSWRRARLLIASAWALSAIFSAPMLVLYEETLIQGETQCWIELGESWKWQLYMSLVSTTLFVIPALIISACYAIIVRTIWMNGSVFIPAERGRNCATPASRRASSRGIIPRAKVKTVKMTFVIVIVFIVCWSPYIIYDLLQVFEQFPRTQTNIAIATFVQSLAPLNSAANPLIYCLFSTQVFRTLKRIPPFRWILSWCDCCKSKGRNSTPIRCTTGGQRLHNSSDSMRTLTSLTVSRRSTNCMRSARVVIVEGPKTVLAMSEV